MKESDWLSPHVAPLSHGDDAHGSGVALQLKKHSKELCLGTHSILQQHFERFFVNTAKARFKF